MLAFLSMFALMVLAYLVTGLSAHRYTQRVRLTLLSVSTFVPVGIFLSWQFV